MWKEGKWQGLETYCQQDTRVLACLTLLQSIRLPGRGSTEGASVLPRLQRDWRTQLDASDTPLRGTADIRQADTDTAPPKRDTSTREKRMRDEPVTGYDEVRRRRVRRRLEEIPYMERATVGYASARRKRKAIVMSAVTLARTVDDRYEWRDAAMACRVQPRQR